MQDYSSVCAACHDAQHSLGFEYAAFLPRISHADNKELVALPPEEKRRLLAERGRPGGALLPTNMDYVGSAACKSCHEPEFATWAASPHAHAVETLASKGEAGNADCLPCHTTGFDRAGGFPGGASVEAHPDLARVGCESCHGPGGEHIKEDAARFGDILSLGDKCDSCVILQICGSCHDDAKDPGFEFELQERIERQRHGTTEPGTGKPKQATAWQPSNAGTTPMDAQIDPRCSRLLIPGAALALATSAAAQFGPQQVLGSPTQPNTVLTADLDGDGDLDVLATAKQAAGSSGTRISAAAPSVPPRGSPTSCPATTTSAPSCAKRAQIERPSPCPPPVTRAVFPASVFTCLSSNNIPYLAIRSRNSFSASTVHSRPSRSLAYTLGIVSLRSVTAVTGSGLMLGKTTTLPG